MIDGVMIRPLERVPDERGYVSHMLRNDDPWFNGFGETYFSAIYPGAIKAWHLHRVMELNYACISGMIKLVSTMVVRNPIHIKSRWSYLLET
jgi:dTDP-4-dehydrorhamnose 3,5-epimerase